MAKINNVTKASKVTNYEGLLSRLVAIPDLRIGNFNKMEGRVSSFFKIIAKNFSSIVIINFLFLLFATPILVLLLYYMPLLIKEGTATMNFLSTLGVGYHNGVSAPSISDGLKIVYETRLLICLYLIPCVTFLGIGASGLFFCARNLVWGIPIKPFSHFFRGIKMHWWKFLITFAYISLVFILFAYSILHHKQLQLIGAVGHASRFLIFVAIVVAVLSLLFIQVAMPMFVAYKYKFKHVIKNSIIISLAMIILTSIVDVLALIPFLLLFVSFGKVIIFVFILSFGFVFYALIFSLLSNYAFENYIMAIYERQNNIKATKTKRPEKKKNDVKENIVDVEVKNKHTNKTKTDRKEADINDEKAVERQKYNERVKRIQQRNKRK